MASMTQAYPLRAIYPGRSDGKRLGPAAPQLQVPAANSGAYNYYQEVTVGKAKSKEWRRKLAMLLMAELGGEPGMQYILAVFPDNYRLFEHRRSPGTPGVSERSDMYLYGYPDGSNKRFRSPAEFFPHLYWLVTDLERDRINCKCKLCAPEGALKAASMLMGGLPESMNDESDKKPGNEAKQQGAVISVKASKAPSISAATPNESLKAPIKIPLTNTVSSIPPTSATVPSEMQTSSNPNFKLDLLPNTFAYRQGELVWVDRGGSQGLSIITARDQRRQGPMEYCVQMLSYPGHASDKIIIPESKLRPWLSWSPPEKTHARLNHASIFYSQINWRDVLAGQYGEGNVEVDASIFAAQYIDGAYTPFDPFTPSIPGQLEVRYGGIFIGGEKIWKGEAVRLHDGSVVPSSQVDPSQVHIMVIKEIIDKPSSAAGAQITELAGNIYVFHTVRYKPGRQIPIDPLLPERLKDDLEYRNRITIARRAEFSYWQLVKMDIRLPLTDVRGRWYQARVMLPIMFGEAAYAQKVRDGQIEEVTMHLNGRGDAFVVPMRRCKTRLDAFGEAVPPGTSIDRSFSEEVQTVTIMPTAPNRVTVANSDQPQSLPDIETQEPEAMDVSDFVDVNQMEESDFN